MVECLVAQRALTSIEENQDSDPPTLNYQIISSNPLRATYPRQNLTLITVHVASMVLRIPLKLDVGAS